MMVALVIVFHIVTYILVTALLVIHYHQIIVLEGLNLI